MFEIVSLVVKKPKVRILLSLATQFNWSLRQLVVKNVFLHGELHELHEEVYIQQPQGFIDKINPTHVCRLKKSFVLIEVFTLNVLHNILLLLVLLSPMLICLYLFGMIVAVLHTFFFMLMI